VRLIRITIAAQRARPNEPGQPVYPLLLNVLRRRHRRISLLVACLGSLGKGGVATQPGVATRPSFLSMPALLPTPALWAIGEENGSGIAVSRHPPPCIFTLGLPRGATLTLSRHPGGWGEKTDRGCCAPTRRRFAFLRRSGGV
jgi:hypothetical protein